MKNQRWNCERCVYYFCPGDAPEGTEPDCIWTPSYDGDYLPCSIEAEYMKKMERIISNRFEAAGDDSKLEADLRVWLQCEWQCNDLFDMGEYGVL